MSYTVTTNIGPCDCCGSGCNGNCIWHGIFLQPSGPYFWQSEGVCAPAPGGGGCACAYPDFPGSVVGQATTTPCLPV